MRDDERPTPARGAAPPDTGAPGKRRPPTPEEARSATRPVMWFSLLLLGALLFPLLTLPWPLSLGSGVLALAALGVGVYALVKVIRVRVGGIILPVLIVSLLFAVYLVVSAVVQAILWEEYAAFQECADRALTVQAERACTDGLEDAVRGRLLG
ncbi:hypothetical protein [Georgenia wangjunii]|uniref:hypothetical protein n=1 Tax=Georgenia wangjunii TaxID=3117730 RepID=UPI002F2602F4